MKGKIWLQVVWSLTVIYLFSLIFQEYNNFSLICDFDRQFYLICASGRNRNSCKVSRLPSLDTKGKDRSSISDTIIDVVKKTAAPVTVLHVTPMGAFRGDAHVGSWSDNPSVPDCSHWCLPGVPDMWNEILFSYLLSKNGTYLQWAPSQILFHPLALRMHCS